MVEAGRARVTAPFETFWFLSLGNVCDAGEVVASWRAQHGVGVTDVGVTDFCATDVGVTGVPDGRSEMAGEAGGCRMGVAFKRRKGTPGYHTLLDANGLLVGRPVPEGWRRVQ